MPVDFIETPTPLPPPSGLPPRTAYPTGDDLADYITSLGIIDAAVLADRLAALNLDQKAAAAARAWENSTQYQPFLANGSDTLRAFDPPASVYMDLEGGLLSLVSLFVGVTLDSPGQELTAERDFYLEPANAPAQGTPYHTVCFRGYSYGWRGWGSFSGPWGWDGAYRIYRDSIRVTGRWGYCVELPEEVWQAILQYGAWLASPQLGLALSGGISEVRVLSSMVRYSGEGTKSPMMAAALGWKANFDCVAQDYRRMSVP